MIKIVTISLQVICLLCSLLVLKLISDAHISDIVVCWGGIFMAVYPLLLRLLFHKNYIECGKNNLEQIKYILMPLLCAEVFVIVLYWQDVLNFVEKVIQVNQ